MCIGGMMNNSWVANTSTVIEGTAKSVDGCWRGGGGSEMFVEGFRDTILSDEGFSVFNSILLQSFILTVFCTNNRDVDCE